MSALQKLTINVVNNNLFTHVVASLLSLSICKYLS